MDALLQHVENDDRRKRPEIPRGVEKMGCGQRVKRRSFATGACTHEISCVSFHALGHGGTALRTSSVPRPRLRIVDITVMLFYLRVQSGDQTGGDGAVLQRRSMRPPGEESSLAVCCWVKAGWKAVDEVL